MRSLSAAALVAFAIVTECFGAHSDRSRQRSSPIRSVPVAADIKRDVDFDCPEEFGYYPHPSDCTLYYVCVFGGALLESCTGGLMYSHELQTCDWPRNVGCDGVSAPGGEELERISEREPPPPPPPRRTPPPPPPRAQPNPVITSRGQPKFNRDEYEKQQQLYAEVDDLPPVEEIESDRQQRVYRGQPSTIGQVQKDRDGYTQVNTNGRNLNSNIIPASISQNNGKIGSFSFGTQVDERRTATVTQAPQAYSGKSDNTTDAFHDRPLDIVTNEIADVIEKPLIRRKRDISQDLGVGDKNLTGIDTISERSSNDQEMEYFEYDTETVPTYGDERDQDDSERGKRQVRYYLKNGYKSPLKNWGVPKTIKLVDLRQLNYNPQNTRLHATYNGLIDNVHNASPEPYSSNSNSGSSANSYQIYQIDDTQQQIPFKPSLPDPTNQKLAHNSGNVATQIITKSPPISALKSHDNPFASLAGGFFNNAPKQNNEQKSNQFISQLTSFLNKPSQHVAFPDSSLLPSTIVTGKPVLMSSTPDMYNDYGARPNKNNEQSKIRGRPITNVNGNQNSKPSNNDDDYNEESESSEDESSENGSSEKDEDHFKHDFPDPPYEFTHPSHKFADIENPFANPNFDFDAFLAKLSGGQYAVMSTPKPRKAQNPGLKTISSPIEVTTSSSSNSGYRSSTLNYKGMSTPRPFSGLAESGIAGRPSENPHISSSTKQTIEWTPRPDFKHQASGQQQQSSLNQNTYRSPQENARLPLEAVRPNLKPPNFKDERQLPINFSFNRPSGSTINPNYDASKQTGENQQVYSVTQKPYVVVTGTGTPLYLSTPKQQYLLKPEKIVLHPHIGSTGKPYLVSSGKPYIAFKSTPKPLTTIANEQLQALRHYWNSNPSSESYFAIKSTPKPNAVSELPKLENLFLQTARPSANPIRGHTIYANIAKDPVSSTTKQPPKRRPIPKPSPEMNDYYYEDDEEDEQYYYEPPVKSKYMPSTEVKPQRPPMAQNYQEYDDSSEEQDERRPAPSRPSEQSPRRPVQYSHRPESVTKNYNDVSVVTKGPTKNFNKNSDGKIPVPVLVNYATSAPTVLRRPEVSNYEIVHHAPRNRTVHIRKPTRLENGPYTQKPPKYLNQTTLRPYTVRHRLAKPTTVNEPNSANDDNTQTRGRLRHQNLVAYIKNTTPRDNHNQETRYTKTKHDDKTNSLEPTESAVPLSYSASPRPKMLYNGTQNYNPDQYDPFYAVYDEDGELYKDTDYVQQYNTASLRPAVQQTYRGTPPPPRRPVETYSPRPVADDYDDALIQGQISNQNQYQSPVRHSTRGEGNELGYEHNPSSVKTTVYEATSISTTPSTTTSTSTTTQRTTTAHITEAMTPSRYTTRSPTDENPKESPEPNPTQNPNDRSSSSILTNPSTIINLSSLAKPFERTDNTHRLSETLLPTEKTPTSRLTTRVTNNNKESVDVIVPSSNDNKKVVSLTSGFSIRRNFNNTNNPYTLTVLSRPLDDYSKSRRRTKVSENIKNRGLEASRYYYESESNKEPQHSKAALDLSEYRTSSESITPRKDTSLEVIDEEIPIYTRPTIYITSKPNYIRTTEPTTTSTASIKYYLKTVLRRPTPFGTNNAQNVDSTENSINTEAIINTALENLQNNRLPDTQPTRSLEKEEIRSKNDRSDELWNEEPIVSPYRALNNLRNNYKNEESFVSESTSTTTSTSRVTSPPSRRAEKPRSKPSYFSYRVLDEEVPDQTTEVFSGTVRNVIKAFFNNFVSTPAPRIQDELIVTTPRTTTTQPEEKTVNIGFQKKTVKYVNEKPTRNNVKRIHIITEPSVSRYVPSNDDTSSFKALNYRNGYSSTTSTSTTTTTPAPIVVTEPSTTPRMLESSTNNEYRNVLSSRFYESDYNSFVSSKPQDEPQKSRKFKYLLNESPTEPTSPDSISYVSADDESTKLFSEGTKSPSENEWDGPTNKLVSEIASTTSTTKATSTSRVEPTSTKSLSFPTRASRVNPAIKLAATNLGGGRRSYQTPSKCSSDNSLQANPKCNEIKYQRPSSTRGRGHAHYSAASDAPAQAPNRGTPPTRSRPTLKPSTAIVSKTTEFVDIYTHPPSRPAPVYPQPTPDKTAAKCRKDVCLLPDCSCGGRDIPGDLPVETVPQIVLLTFDDSVNDLNKGLYMDLFEKGRVNPNGCPITATFYVSHEWTDYSQVQNLYAAGHEMASHTVSHSFGEQFSQKKWNREVGGQREILAAYGGVKLEDVRGMRAPFLSVGGNKMFKMLYDSNFTYDSSMPVYENRPPSWPYTLDYKLFHDCMIPPCPTKSYPGVWEVPMVMWQDLNGGRCSMGDACANPPDAEGVYKMILKNFDRHYTTNRAPFGLYYHAAWFTQPHHKEGFIMFLDFINQMQDVWIVTNWQALQWVRDPTPISRINNFQPFQCNYQDRPKKCNNPKVCNLWHKSGVRYMRTCQPCPEVYPWTGKTGIRSSRIDNDVGE